MEYLALFPTPVGIVKLPREFTDEEQEFFNSVRTSTQKNVGNIVSKNTYILENEKMKSLKKFFQKEVNNFLQSINPSKYYIELYITQSWINYTDKHQYHHIHRHPNSFISGVFYMNAKKEYDHINFLTPLPPQTLRYQSSLYGQFNSVQWQVPVETNMLILFPSTLEHHVSVHEQDYERVSLSFNTFLKGKIGDNDALTELTLN